LGIRDLGLAVTFVARLAVLMLVALLAACGSKGSPAAPSAPVSQTQFSARIDGTTWTTPRAYVSSFAGNTSITASDGDRSRMFAILFSGPARTGVHRIEYVEDLSVSVYYLEGGALGPAWTSFSPIASGEVTVTTVTDRSLVGTFSVVLSPFSPAASGLKTIEGTFNIAR
jgi:predicted small lipoprotein YifL